jgi:hypothetical protein
MGTPLNSAPSRERVISSTVKLISDYVKSHFKDFSGGLYILGLDTSLLAMVVPGLSRKLGTEGIGVYLEQVNGAKEMDIGDFCLEGLARVYAQRFYSKCNPNKDIIVVEGQPSEEKQRFMYHLRNRVEVFVESDLQFPYKDRGFRVNFSSSFSHL